jgi:hypothetical protein
MMLSKKSLLEVFAASSLILSSSPLVLGFGVKPASSVVTLKSALHMAQHDSRSMSIVADQNEEEVNVEGYISGQPNPEAMKLKSELLKLADRTNRGFQASTADRKKAKELIFDLARFNPTPEPASPYYSNEKEESTPTPTLVGKWTLVYTDAPDITGLDTSSNPFSTAKLGRIGQECNPPYIKNVIEWQRPDWANNLPFSGSEESRVLQQIVPSASATPDKPLLVDLKIAGFELVAGASDDSSSESDLASRIRKQGIPAGLLSINPVDLKGPWNPTFGQFEILYVDEDFRMIKTGQNYLAVNQRIKSGEEWF